MTYNEILHIKLMEECGESIQRISKVLRFGERQIQDGHKLNNRDRVQEELLDIIFMINRLGYRVQCTNEEYNLRLERLVEYNDRSRKFGILET